VKKVVFGKTLYFSSVAFSVAVMGTVLFCFGIMLQVASAVQYRVQQTHETMYPLLHGKGYDISWIQAVIILVAVLVGGLVITMVGLSAKELRLLDIRIMRQRRHRKHDHDNHSALRPVHLYQHHKHQIQPNDHFDMIRRTLHG
jgi:hypothetical protein